MARPGAVGIIGGGVIGLSIGWRLAQAGIPTMVFERGQAGQGASHAAAGMLAAVSETEPGEETLLTLTRASQLRWSAFARDLEEVSGRTIGYRREGTLMVALTRDDAEQLRFTYDTHRRLGLPVSWLTGKEVLALEPRLNPRIAAGVFSADDHQVDNRHLAMALAIAFQQAGGTLHEHTTVEEIEVTSGDGGNVTGLIANGRSFPVSQIILCAGAWSRLKGLPPRATPPVRPVKGQMLALRMPAASPLLRHVIWAPKAYLVPRLDGRLIVGATVEERGFDEAMTAGGLLALLDGAWRALPGIEELPIDEIWTGFRPGSPDDAPILGPSGVTGLTLACGHHRNGILLTPITADLISQYVLTGVLPPALEAFGLSRFTRGSNGQRHAD